MTDISQPNWSEVDISNSDPAPLGAPEGMAPSGVNDTMRQMMGATKRFWDRINGPTTAANTGNAYSLAYTVPPSSLVSGELFTFRAAAANTGAAFLNVGTGSQPLRKMAAGGPVALNASDIMVGSYVMAAWDSVSAQFVALNIPADTSSLSFVLNTDIHSVCQVLETHINAVSAAAAAGGGSAGEAITSLDSRINSVNVAWAAEIASASVALDTRINALSASLETRVHAVSVTVSNLHNEILSLSATMMVRLQNLSNDLFLQITSVSNTVSIIAAQLASVSFDFNTRINALSSTVSILAIAINTASAQAASANASLNTALTTAINTASAQAQSANASLNTALASAINTVSAAVVAASAAAVSNNASLSACLDAAITTAVNTASAQAASANASLNTALTTAIANVSNNAISANTSLSNALGADIRSLSASVSLAVANRRPICWANFIGTNPVTNKAGFNFKSITRSSLGRYVVHFTNLPDTTQGLAVAGMSAGHVLFMETATLSFVKVSSYSWGSGSLSDAAYVSVVVFANSAM